MFLNSRKIPVISRLFHSNKSVTDFKKKVDFFAKQCSLIKNESKRLHLLTAKSLSTVKFVNTDILKIIQILNSSKGSWS